MLLLSLLFVAAFTVAVFSSVNRSKRYHTSLFQLILYRSAMVFISIFFRLSSLWMKFSDYGKIKTICKMFGIKTRKVYWHEAGLQTMHVNHLHVTTAFQLCPLMFNTCREDCILSTYTGFGMDWGQDFFQIITNHNKSWKDFYKVSSKMYSYIKICTTHIVAVFILGTSVIFLKKSTPY